MTSSLTNHRPRQLRRMLYVVATGSLDGRSVCAESARVGKLMSVDSVSIAMSLYAQLQELLVRVTVGLRMLPGATELYLFGSLTTPEADAYADIDLQVTTTNLPLTYTDWPYVLEHIHPIEVAWAITPKPDNTSFAIIFQSTSYYHKIDIGLSAATDGLPAASIDHTAVRLWAQEPQFSPLSRPRRSVYNPVYGSVGHQLVEELMSAVRYVKARKRGHQLTCWRFMRSQPEKLLHLFYEQMNRWTPRANSLTTWDYKNLDVHSDKELREAIMCHLNWSIPPIMDENFYWFVEQTIQCYKQKAAAYDEYVPAEIIYNALAFLRSELTLEAHDLR